MKKAFFIILSIFISVAVQGQECTAVYKKVEKEIGDLQKILSCGPQYTALECKENLGIRGTAISAVGALGATAGRAVRKVPLACGLRGGNLFQSILSEAHASTNCAPAIQEVTGTLSTALKDSIEIQKTEVAADMFEKIKKDPQFSQLSKLAEQSSRMDQEAWSKFVKEHGSNLGLSANAKMPRTESLSCGTNDKCKKFSALFNAHSSPRATWQIWDEFHDHYKGSNDFGSRIGRVLDNERQVKGIMGKIAGGGIKDASRLSAVVSESARHIHSSMYQRMSGVLAGASKALNSKELSATLGFFKKSTELASGVAKKLPMGIGALVTVGAASAHARPFDEALAGLASVGEAGSACEMRDHISRFVDFDPVTCKQNYAFSEKLQNFLHLNEKEMKEALCAPGLAEHIAIVHAEHFGKKVSATCLPNGEVQVIYPDGTYTAKIDRGLPASVRFASPRTVNTVSRLGVSEYSLNFNNEGQVSQLQTMTRGKGEKTYGSEVLSRTDFDLGSNVFADYSRRQPLLQLGVSCCGGELSGEVCSKFAKAQGSGASSVQSSEGSQ